MRQKVTIILCRQTRIVHTFSTSQWTWAMLQNHAYVLLPWQTRVLSNREEDRKPENKVNWTNYWPHNNYYIFLHVFSICRTGKSCLHNVFINTARGSCNTARLPGCWTKLKISDLRVLIFHLLLILAMIKFGLDARCGLVFLLSLNLICPLPDQPPGLTNPENEVIFITWHVQMDFKLFKFLRVNYKFSHSSQQTFLPKYSLKIKNVTGFSFLV